MRDHVHGNWSSGESGCDCTQNDALRSAIFETPSVERFGDHLAWTRSSRANLSTTRQTKWVISREVLLFNESTGLCCFPSQGRPSTVLPALWRFGHDARRGRRAHAEGSGIWRERGVGRKKVASWVCRGGLCGEGWTGDAALDHT